MDYALAMAYEMVESEKCPQCGVPAHWAYSEDNAIEFEMEEVTCWACVHKDGDKKAKDAKAGVTHVLKAVAVEGYELPDRADFIRVEMEKQKRKEERLAKEKAE